jgi:phosphoenolpyruvate carboxylase
LTLHSKKTTSRAFFPINYDSFGQEEKINCLLNIDQVIGVADTSTEIAKDTVESIFAINSIQQINGVARLSSLYHQ